jgi:O-antigen ligase
MGVSLPAFLAYAVWCRGPKKRLVSSVLAGITGLVLVMSASSSGMITALVGIAVFLGVWRAWVLWLYLPAAAWLLWQYLGNIYPASYMVGMVPMESVLGRIQIWSSTIAALMQSPLTGLGLGTWIEKHVPVSWEPVPTAHNDYLQLYSDAGLLGMIALATGAAIFVVTTRRVWRGKDRGEWFALGAASAVAIIAFAVNGICETFITGALITNVVGKVAVEYVIVAVPLNWGLLALYVIGTDRLSHSHNVQEVSHRHGLARLLRI